MRLFIAITLPPQIKRQLAAYAGSIGALSLRAKLTRQENFHLTAAFLGDALTEAEACSALAQVNGGPFKLYSDKPGLFKRGGGHIHWLGLKSSAELQALHEKLAAELKAVGFSLESRPFSPHITLAREVHGFCGELPPPPRFIIPVNGLTLMESAHIGGLLTYIPLYEKRLNIT
jgi:2'-5' RNA ligase